MELTQKHIDRMASLLGEGESTEPLPRSNEEFLRAVTAEDIVGACSPYVVGQDEALGQIAEYFCLWLRWHFALKDGASRNDLPAMKAVTVVGPTASGKTFIIRKVSKYLGVNFREISAASLTGEGWRGASLSEHLSAIAQEQQADAGLITVVFVDEVDKTALSSKYAAEASFCPLFDFLSALDSDGTYTSFTKSGMGDSSFTLRTDDCLWVFAGAFTGIGNGIVRPRLASRLGSSYGLLSDGEAHDLARLDEQELRLRLSPDDLVAYGMPSEWVGRAGCIVSVPCLSKESLASIASGSEHSLEVRFGALFPEKVRFGIDSEAAEYLAERALESCLGARMIENGLIPLASQALAHAWREEGVVCASVGLDEERGVLAVRYANGEGEIVEGRE